MIRLIRSNLYRLVRSKMFWGVLIANIAFNLWTILTDSSGYSIDNGPLIQDINEYFFSGATGSKMVFGLLGLNMTAVSCALFGTDYSNGTIRNKLITGKRRSDIYFANLVTSVIIGLIFTIVYYFLVFAVAYPMRGGLSEGVTTQEIVLNLVCTMFIICSHASIITFICMLSRNLPAGIVLSMMSIAVTMGLSFLLTVMLSERPTNSVFEYLEGVRVWIGDVPNPKYISSPSLRKFIEVMIFTSPTGQSMEILNNPSEIEIFYQYLGASASVVAVANTSGYLIFRKLDLK